MTAVLDVSRLNWLHQETPLGVPAFTPLRIRTSSENCYFQMDGYIVRMVYLGGLSGSDPSATSWSLRTTPQADFNGIKFWNGWRTQPTKSMIVLLQKPPVQSENELHEYREALANIERMSGFSRRDLTEWLQTSHTTLNGIATSARVPRSGLASRIANFSRLVARLQAIFGDDKNTIRRALTAEPKEGPSALSLVLEGDYQRAATAAQYAIRPRRQLKPVPGESYMDSPMIAVETI